MPVKNAAKILARSRSLAFTRDHLARGASVGQLRTYSWRGTPIHYRAGTSDTGLIYNILLKRGSKGEYCPPDEFPCDWDRVKVVLDIGANIGIAALYFANIFPNAAIHAFEPEPGNSKLLAQNTARCERIRCHPFALGSKDGELTLFDSDDRTNQGGFSAHDSGTNPAPGKTVQMRHAGAFLAELGITAVDVIKIDTEGAEWDILTACDPNLLERAQLILGELHGHRDFALLDYLQPTFHIGLTKGIRKRLFNFYAVNRHAQA
jgi:FkbM family methyltransferase